MPKPPTSYDDITRKTVPDLDSSFRPSAEQVRQAREGFRALDADEQALSDRVAAALAGSGVSFEIERDQVTLQGTVRDADALARVGDLVRGIAGVGSVVDRVVIAP